MANFALEEEEDRGESLLKQAISFFLHTVIAVAAWLGMMMVGYALNPVSAPQGIVLLLSIVVPLIVGNIVARIRPNEMASHVWLAGLIWILVMGLWIIDMPTGPNACMDCGATDKLMRTLFSIPKPSGLIDNNGPFFGTWPAAATLGYSIGAYLAMRGRRD
jgi:hypothetical protein